MRVLFLSLSLAVLSVSLVGCGAPATNTQNGNTVNASNNTAENSVNKVPSPDTVPPNPESLLDKMTGKWVMTGVIDKEQITHDVEVDWILNRRYIRIHEVSREKDADGELAYEAWIHIAWDPKNGEYVVMWLDNTGTTNFAAEGVGHGKPNGDRIPFVWKSAGGGGIHNTFAYDRDSDKWSWAIDNIDETDKPSSFARVTLERKKN